MTVPPQEIFTATEAAEYLGITSGHLLELLCSGSLKGRIFI
jgi:excisionase family DNA binding protein